MEILAVDDRRDVIFEFREGVPPLHLLGICCRSPCHVVDRSYGNASGTGLGSADQIDHRTGSTVGASLKLPPWLEEDRPELERLLPRVELPRIEGEQDHEAA